MARHCSIVATVLYIAALPVASAATQLTWSWHDALTGTAARASELTASLTPVACTGQLVAELVRSYQNNASPDLFSALTSKPCAAAAVLNVAFAGVQGGWAAPAGKSGNTRDSKPSETEIRLVGGRVYAKDDGTLTPAVLAQALDSHHRAIASAPLKVALPLPSEADCDWFLIKMSEDAQSIETAMYGHFYDGSYKISRVSAETLSSQFGPPGMNAFLYKPYSSTFYARPMDVPDSPPDAPQGVFASWQTPHCMPSAQPMSLQTCSFATQDEPDDEDLESHFGPIYPRCRSPPVVRLSFSAV